MTIRRRELVLNMLNRAVEMLDVAEKESGVLKGYSATAV